MLISVLRFGSAWSRRRDDAYYNTTGVMVTGKVRNRPLAYGVARFNGLGGFLPERTEWMIFKVFECEPPCVWNGHNKVLFKRLLPKPARPDAYLVTRTEEQTGGVDAQGASRWSHADAQLISFSESDERQEVMLVMPPYAWIRGGLGTFFLEPQRHKPWQAHLVLSPAV